MSLKSKIKKALVSLACIGTFLNPTINIENKPKEPVSIEEIVEYSPSISFEMPKAEARDRHLEGRLAVLSFDVLFNGLKSGFGAMDKGDDFWPAFGKGALSGLIVYGGKEIASHNFIPFAGAMGKITHDFGVSMSDNIMRGEDIFSRFRTDFGPIEFDFDLQKKDVDFYFHPFSAGALIYLIARGDKFDIKNTLYNLTPVFYWSGDRSLQSVKNLKGVTLQNIFAYKKDPNSERIMISHEMNHVLFNSEFRFLDDLMGKKSDIIKEIPILSPFAEAFDYMKFGPLLGNGIFRLPEYINPDAYYWVIPELEAYTMQRPRGRNPHPFYKE